MAQRPKPKETKKAVDATVIDEEILKYLWKKLEKLFEITWAKTK